MMKTFLIYSFHILLLLSLTGCPSRKETVIDEDLPYMETDPGTIISSAFRFQDTGLFMNYHGRKDQVGPENILNLKDFIKETDVIVSYIDELGMLIITLKEPESGWKSYLASGSMQKGIYTIKDILLVASDKEKIEFTIPHGIERVFTFDQRKTIYVTRETDKEKLTTHYEIQSDGKFREKSYMFHGSQSLVEYTLGEINEYIVFEDQKASWETTYCRLPFSTKNKKYDLVIRKLNSRVPKDYLCIVKDGEIDLENALYLTSHIPDNIDGKPGFYNYYEILNDTTFALEGDESVKGWGISGKRYYRVSDEGEFYAVRKTADGKFIPAEEDNSWTLRGYYEALSPIVLPISDRNTYRELFTSLPYRLYHKLISTNHYLYEDVKVGKLLVDEPVNVIIVDCEHEDNPYVFISTFTKDWKEIDSRTLAITSYYGYESRRVRTFAVTETGVINIQENWDDVIVLNEYYAVDSEGKLVEYAEENLEVIDFESGEEGGDYMVSTYIWEWNGKRWLKELVKEEKYIWKDDDSRLEKWRGEEES